MLGVALLVAVSCLVVAPAVAVGVGRATPSRFPGLPKRCGVKNYIAPELTSYRDCLLSQDLVAKPGGGVGWVPAGVSITVSPQVVSIGQRLTLTIQTKLKFCTPEQVVANQQVKTQTPCLLQVFFGLGGAREGYIPSTTLALPPAVRFPAACSQTPSQSLLQRQPAAGRSCSGIVFSPGAQGLSLLADHWVAIGAYVQASGGARGGYVEAAFRVAAHAPPPSRLNVLVSVPKTIRSGLGVHDVYQHFGQSLVAFVEAKRQPGFGAVTFQCESGCADVLVTVRDPKTHELVLGSAVDVRATTLTGAPGGREYVCERDPKTGQTMGGGDCGPGSLLDLRTDDLGHVYLRYWVPGVIKPTPVTFQVEARGGTCIPHPCSAGTQPGVTNTDLTIEPYLIYQHSAALSQDNITELANWAGGPSLFHLFLSGTTWAEKAFSTHLKWLEAEELASEHEIAALEHLEKTPLRVLFGAIELYNTWTELSEHWSMIGLFLQNTGLSGAGLGNNPLEASAAAYPSYPFTKQLANYNGLIPGNLGQAVGKGESGAWWDIATTLRALVNAKDSSVQPGARDRWGIRLEVFEISHCDPHESCDPGYESDRGIQAELYFQIALLYNGRPSSSGASLYTLTTPYDALAWTEAQQTGGPQQGKLLGVIHGQ